MLKRIATFAAGFLSAAAIFTGSAGHAADSGVVNECRVAHNFVAYTPDIGGPNVRAMFRICNLDAATSWRITFDGKTIFSQELATGDRVRFIHSTLNNKAHSIRVYEDGKLAISGRTPYFG